MNPSNPSPPGLIESLPAPPPGRVGWPWTTETSPALYEAAPAGGWPKITIVCPSFEQGRYIEETIRSVLLQNYPNLEFLIMDGGSRDETAGLLRRYGPWLTHWESQPDRGQSHALNKACTRATGDLLGWINSDDYYLSGSFAAVGRSYRQDGPALIYGNDQVRQGDAPALVPLHRQPAFRFQVAVGGVTLPSHATFWPRASHQSLNEELRFTMDADLYKRLAAAGLKPRHLPEFLGVFRSHDASKTARLRAVAEAETAQWSRAQPWTTHWLWRLSRLIDRVRR